MYMLGFRCHDCGKQYGPDEPIYRCTCGGPVDVIYDYDAIHDRLDWGELKRRGFDHHRYTEFFPVVHDDHQVSLGEGGTPLLRASALEETLDVGELYFKIEGMNPTGSFKDRGTAVEVGKALDHGAEEIVVASTGNMGASIAAYCARAGLDANIFIPESVSGPKRKQMEAHGAELHPVDGDYATAAEQAHQAHEDEGWYLMGDYAYRGEGEKSVGLEIMDQARPDTVVLPVGNGTLMHGTYKGIRELNVIDLIDHTPRMVGFQAEGCNTVARAFQEGLDTVPTADSVDTDAGAIACADPLDGAFALDAIRESGGFADAVSDAAMADARNRWAEEEGIYAELSCGAALAGLLDNRDRFGPEETVVCVVTGHGLKD